jgi:hypothetical protein
MTQGKDKMNELDIEVEKINLLEPPFEVKLNSNNFIRYFKWCYKVKTGNNYSMADENYARFGAAFKSRVSDELIEKYEEPEVQIEKLKEFLKWVFDLEPTYWHLHKVPRLMASWIKQMTEQQVAKKSRIFESAEALEEDKKQRRVEEERFARYLGEGYFDAELNKTQYWLGLIWRKKYLKHEQLVALKQWQEDNYNEKTIKRLDNWYVQFAERRAFNPTKAFFTELASSRGQKLSSLLNEFHRRELYSKFTTEELEKEV